MMRIKLCLIVLAFAFNSCLETQFELHTKISADGGGARELLVTSKDGNSFAEHPKSMCTIPHVYIRNQQRLGFIQAIGVFNDINSSPSPLSFELERVRTAPIIEHHLEIIDCFLLKHFTWQEDVKEIINQDDIQQAQLEIVEVSMEVLATAVPEFFGADEWAQHRLSSRSPSEIKTILLDAVEQVWQLLATKYGVAAQDIEEQLIVITHNAMRELELEINLNDEQLEFDERFEDLFEAHLLRKFGSEEAANDWAEIQFAKLSGLFGPSLFIDFGHGSFRFLMSVEMPGDLLNTNANISGANSSFLELSGEQIFPYGAGLKAESILWNEERLAALPFVEIKTDNRSALRLMKLLQDQQANIDEVLVATLAKCEQQQSLSALQKLSRAQSSEDHSQYRSAQAAKLYQWLEG